MSPFITIRKRKELNHGSDCRLRLLILGTIVLIAFLIMWGRLYYLQILSGNQHTEKISRQSLRRIRIPTQRGRIYTRDGMILADNILEFELLFYPEEMLQKKRRATVEFMYNNMTTAAKAIGREPSLSRNDIEKHLNQRPGIPLKVFSHLDSVQAARAMEFSRSCPGSEVSPAISRVYPQKQLACHLIGYTSDEQRDKAEDKADFFYYIPDRIGRDGIEKAFDQLQETNQPGLRGRPGFSLIQVDHLGYARSRMIDQISPVHGNNVILTIDGKAQQIAEQLLQGQKGAIVILDADNGDIIAAASAPGFDLSRFTPRISPQYYQILRNNPDNPLFPRALCGSYTPGSILKPATMLAMLNAGLSPDTVVDCDGGSQIGNAKIRCASYRRGGHGEVTVRNAINWSCNDFLIENAVNYEPEIFFNILQSCGFGDSTGVELAENKGILPSEDIKRRRYGNRWNRYDTALLSIGQGIITISPLQAAAYAGALANGGIVWENHLVDRVVDNHSMELYRRTPEIRSRLNTSAEYLQIIKESMFDVVNSPTGSGRRAGVDGLEIYGKTGSAETGKRGNLKITAWFIAFVTYQGKTYSMAITLENSGSGGGSCAPLASEFFQRYLLEE